VQKKTPTDAKRPAGVISLIGGYRGDSIPKKIAILAGKITMASRNN
jgi:hypothetical protein